MPVPVVRNICAWEERWPYKQYDVIGKPRQLAFAALQGVTPPQFPEHLDGRSQCCQPLGKIEDFPEIHADAIMRSWGVEFSGAWRRAESIHVTEGRVVIMSARHVLRTLSDHGHELLLLCDNLSFVLGASKGRTTNFLLLIYLRRLLALELCSGCRFHVRWICSEANLGDPGWRAPSAHLKVVRPQHGRDGKLHWRTFPRIDHASPSEAERCGGVEADIAAEGSRWSSGLAHVPSGSEEGRGSECDCEWHSVVSASDWEQLSREESNSLVGAHDIPQQITSVAKISSEPHVSGNKCCDFIQAGLPLGASRSSHFRHALGHRPAGSQARSGDWRELRRLPRGMVRHGVFRGRAWLQRRPGLGFSDRPLAGGWPSRHAPPSSIPPLSRKLEAPGTIAGSRSTALVTLNLDCCMAFPIRPPGVWHWLSDYVLLLLATVRAFGH